MRVTFEWHPVSITPELNTPIIYLTTNGKVGVFKGVRTTSDWLGHYVSKYSITYWAYTSDLTNQIG